MASGQQPLKSQQLRRTVLMELELTKTCSHSDLLTLAHHAGIYNHEMLIL